MGRNLLNKEFSHPMKTEEMGQRKRHVQKQNQWRRSIIRKTCGHKRNVLVKLPLVINILKYLLRAESF